MNGPRRVLDSEIQARCRLERWDFVKTQDFCFYVEALDEAYMAHVAAVQKEEERKREASERSKIPPRKR